MANCTIFGRWAQPVFYVKPYLQDGTHYDKIVSQEEEEEREEIIEKRKKKKKKNRNININININRNTNIHTYKAQEGADNKICKFSKYLFLF